MLRSQRKQCRHAQSGQSLVEYLIILPSLLLIILGAIQLAFIYQAKSTLNYATFLAARQGAMNNGRLCLGLSCSSGGMELGLAYGLLPLHVRSSGNVTKTDIVKGMGLPPFVANVQGSTLWAVKQSNPLRQAHIETINPQPAWVNAAKQRNPYTGTSEVPNDNLMYRSSNPIGGGATSMNLQDGNLLKIKVTYCFKMEVPLINRIIYSLNNSLDPMVTTSTSITGAVENAKNVVPSGVCAALNLVGANSSNFYAGYYLPLVSSATVRMQSPYIGP